MVKPVKCALYFFSFAPAAPLRADVEAVRRHLHELWEGCGRLGMTQALFPDRTQEFPDLSEETVLGFHVLAGRGDLRGEATSEAFLFARHDVTGLAAALVPNRDPDELSTWAELAKSWREAAPSDPPEAILGEALVLVALDDRKSGAVDPAGAGRAVWQGAHDAGYELWTPWYRTANEMLVWDGAGPGALRVVALVAPAETEAWLNDWLWWSGRQDLAPFARYLVDSSKLRYEARVYPARRRDLERSMDEVDRPLSALLRTEAGDAQSRARLEDLLRAQADLYRAQHQSFGLTHATSRLKELQRTIAIARRNLTLASPSPHPDWEEAPDSLFARDLQFADLLSEQIDNDLGYANAVTERANGAQQLTSMRLEQSADRHARAQERISLLQTTVLGALLVAVGGIGTLSISFGVHNYLKLPLLTALMALLVAIPPLAMDWNIRYGLFDHLAAAALTGTAAWLAAAAIWHAPTAGFQWPVFMVAVLGSLVGPALTLQHDGGLGRIRPRASSA
jgi:hypothetical protein